MKKIYLILGVIALVGLVSFGAVEAGRFLYSPAVPYDHRSNPIAADNLALTPTVFSSTTETVICSGECVIDRIIMTSGTAGAYLVVRDTGTADGSGTSITGNLIFGDFSKDGIYSRDPLLGQKLKSTAGKGITMDLSSVAGGESVTVFWRKIGD